MHNEVNIAFLPTSGPQNFTVYIRLKEVYSTGARYLESQTRGV